ncbi:MAG: preprotein translocase subunit SecA [Deltaproteobacteria bacterium]|nr:preprotein translocase subunit SecA [Deltaproteobacteria bacterium]
MLFNRTEFPPASHILRPEKADRRTNALDRIYKNLVISFSSPFKGYRRRLKRFAGEVEQLSSNLEGLTETELGTKADELRAIFRREGMTEKNASHAFAIIREFSSRIKGLKHFDTQIAGGKVMLDGMIAEMETGEGKTLTATLAAGTVALAGIPVHVITVNDYLTQRDAEWTSSIYSAMGLTTGFIIHGMTPEERRRAYEKDIVYCTNKEIVFDYLKDWLILEDRGNKLKLHAEYLYNGSERIERLLLRGLHFAIVDEADSVLIDEARTPLIISGQSETLHDEHKFFHQAIDLAGKLTEGRDYSINIPGHEIRLTPGGEEMIVRLSAGLGPLWTGKVRRAEIVRLALSAIHFFKPDEQYMVRDGKVQIIDEFTGRVMADRSYEKGLHQLIEVKEGCEISKQTKVLARISYQRFFRRYIKLSGMTGTAREVKNELIKVYGLNVITVPTYKPNSRKLFSDRVFYKEEEKWEAVSERVYAMHKEGRPVLIGTHSVAASEKAGKYFAAKGLPFRILNAKQDREEADIIAQAGNEYSITIATNMAGRGVDIKLSEKVSKLNGLHVILTERHEAGRIDRQLAGRCARMGDPGSFEAMLSLDDTLLEKGRAGLWKWMAVNYPFEKTLLFCFLSKKAILYAQKRMEHIHSDMRKNLLKEDERRGNMLSFSGRSE